MIELQPFEWTPADLDPDVVTLIRENYPRTGGRMNSFSHRIRAHRLQAQCYLAEADYFAAEGDAKHEQSYRNFAADYERMADELEAAFCDHVEAA